MVKRLMFLSQTTVFPDSSISFRYVNVSSSESIVAVLAAVFFLHFAPFKACIIYWIMINSLGRNFQKIWLQFIYW